MAWEWVSPVVSGVVAVSSLGFAWRTSTDSQDAAKKLAGSARAAESHARVRTERRDAYLEFQQRLGAVRQCLLNLNNMAKWAGSGDEKLESLSAAGIAFGDATVSVRLVGPKNVADHALNLLTDVGPSITERRLPDGTLMQLATDAMSAELGYDKPLADYLLTEDAG